MKKVDPELLRRSLRREQSIFGTGTVCEKNAPVGSPPRSSIFGQGAFK